MKRRKFILLQPAGTFEECFVKLAKLKELTKDQIAQLFKAHGMSIAASPLAVD